jgi:two-component system, NtrC family, response regulator GlrR
VHAEAQRHAQRHAGHGQQGARAALREAGVEGEEQADAASIAVTMPLTLMAARAKALESGWRREIVARSPCMQRVLADARAAAGSDVNVLILGASGTGKELLARALHAASPRFGKPLAALHCGALPEPLLESELFGHVRGAFPGAVREHPGLFQEARGGTLLLDEIGEMPSALQAKLLRALQERQVRAVGATQPLEIDVRVVSATQRDLRAEIAAGRFREDLYYRLGAVTLSLPPLAARREDIPLLAAHFLPKLAARHGKRVGGFAPDAVALLLTAPWPGNVRQLHDVLEKCVAACSSRLLPAALVRRALAVPGDDLAAFDEARRRFELEFLTRILRITDGNVAQAAKLAKRNRGDFHSLLARHRLDAAAFKPAKP